MTDKIKITKEQSERVGTIHISDYKKCPECGQPLSVKPEDFFGDACLEWCDSCDWKNYEVIDK